MTDEQAPQPEQRHLFGFEGDEILQDDPFDVIELWLDHHGDDDEWPTSVQITEWTSRPAGSYLPSPDWVIERVSEKAADDIAWDEAYEALESTGAEPDVVAAFQAALDLWKTKTVPRFSIADEVVRTHEVTFDYEAGKVLLNGEPSGHEIERTAQNTGDKT